MNKYNATFDLSMGRMQMFKVGLSCIWHSALGTGHIHFHEIGCDNLIAEVKGVKDD